MSQFLGLASRRWLGVGEIDHANTVDPVGPAPAGEFGWPAADARVGHARPFNLDLRRHNVAISNDPSGIPGADDLDASVDNGRVLEYEPGQ